MKYTVIMTVRALRDMESIARWWASERSAAEADRWISGFQKKLRSLGASPQRFPRAREQDRFPEEIRELHYSLRGRPTHRAVFIVEGQIVLVVAVRHAAQQDLEPEDLR